MGTVEIEEPRDREGSFEPMIIGKRQRRLSGADQMVMSLTAKGLTTGEVRPTLGRSTPPVRPGTGGDDPRSCVRDRFGSSFNIRAVTLHMIHVERPAVIVDAQVHTWAADTPDRPWIPGGAVCAHSTDPFEAPNLLAEMDRVGVDRALLVSPTWEGDRNDLVLAAAEYYPDRFGAIVRFDLQDPSHVANVEQWAADSRVCGARVVFFRRSAEWMRDGTADWF